MLNFNNIKEPCFFNAENLLTRFYAGFFMSKENKRDFNREKNFDLLR